MGQARYWVPTRVVPPRWRAGVSFPSILVFCDESMSWLVDGCHRRAAAIALGRTTILAQVSPGGLLKAIGYAAVEGAQE
jgi:hypothetical protein